MFLKKISLIGFKNFQHTDATFNPKFNCFVGLNGMEKTNILDAIYYLSFCKSFFNAADNQNIKKDSPFFVIQGDYNLNNENLEIFCGQKRNEKKQFKKNKKEYTKLSEHIGLLPLVMISPDDSEIIEGGSEIRRKFIDSVICQYNKKYLQELIRYNRALLQRNALLKVFAEKRTFDFSALEIYDEQLSLSGNFIFGERQNFFKEFNEIFSTYHQLLTRGAEEVSITYCSSLHELTMQRILALNLDKDRSTEYTTGGIHKDDIDFEVNGLKAKKFASQGQQKSLLVALKIAQYCFIQKVKQILPILLLDDIYDKLDEERLTKLMEVLNGDNFGQVFITDTHKERMELAIKKTNADVKLFNITDNSIRSYVSNSGL